MDQALISQLSLPDERRGPAASSVMGLMWADSKTKSKKKNRWIPYSHVNKTASLAASPSIT